jgi:2,4-dienoyl-CoA reductase-like NADH-dependent reductase (Old Yellow Enzyme family)
MQASLFSPLQLRDIQIPNRVMLSPMWQYRGERGFPTDWHLMHLGRFASGGTGLVFQEGTAVERRGCGTVGDLGIWDDAFIEPLKRIVDFIRAQGSVPAIQLMHAGRKAKQVAPHIGRGPITDPSCVEDWDDWDMVAPSALAVGRSFEAPREMTRADIDASLDAWAAAARRANAAGYDVAEIHGAHGYLVHEFLSPATNLRTDGYGGDFNGRTRYLMEIVERVREHWPASKPLFVRLSCFDGAGWELEDTLKLVPMLVAAGVDLIDCSAGGITGSPLTSDETLRYCYQAELARKVREATGVKTAAVGLIVHAEHAEELVATGAADLIAVGREMLYNPNWALDAAQKLGVDPDFEVVNRHTGFWLERRAKSVPNFQLSTFPLEA